MIRATIEESVTVTFTRREEVKALRDALALAHQAVADKLAEGLRRPGERDGRRVAALLRIEEMCHLLDDVQSKVRL